MGTDPNHAGSSRRRRKLATTDGLAQLADEAGLSLVDLAIGFVRMNPAVSAMIIGPQLPEQFDGYLAVAEAIVEPDVLDRIDEIDTPPRADSSEWPSAG